MMLYDRQAQTMGGTANEPGALRHLLDDKQNDLELAARIGKSLLERNRELDRQLRDSEKQMTTAMDTIDQLRHTLGMKEELLQMWNHDALGDDSAPGDASTTDSDERQLRCSRSDSTCARGSLQASQEEIDLIHRKLQALEEEHISIRNTRTEEQTVTMRECMRKLCDAVAHIKSLSTDQFKRSDAMVRQQTQVNNLAARSRELENSLNQAGITNEVLASRVAELNEVNQNLARELREMKDKYDESLTLYADAQASVRKLRGRSRRSSLRPTCLVYSPLNAQRVAPVDKGFSVPPDVFLFPSPHGEQRAVSIADELTTSTFPEKATRFDPNHLSSGPKVDPLFATQEVGAEIQTSRGLSAVHTDCGEWDDPTLDSSGFVSCSEPIETTQQTPGRPNPPDSRNNRPTGSSQQMAFVEGSFEVDVNEEMLSTAGEEDADDDGERYEEDSSEFVRQVSFNPLQKPLYRSPFRAFRRQNLPGFSRQQGALGVATAPQVSHQDWLADRVAALSSPPQHSLDDSALGSTTVASSVTQFNYRPQRLQLVKQFQGSGVLERWQQLATPSITSALFESPVSGVASRGSTSLGGMSNPKQMYPSPLSTYVPPPLSPAAGPPTRWSSGLDLSRLFPNPSDTNFIPIDLQKTKAENRDTLFCRFLSNSCQRLPSVTPTVERRPTAFGGVRCESPAFHRGRRQASPVLGSPGSPLCRGLLDFSDLVSSPLDTTSVPQIKVPVLRSGSPTLEPAATTTSRSHKPNLARCPPTLKMVQEEEGCPTLPRKMH